MSLKLFKKNNQFKASFLWILFGIAVVLVASVIWGGNICDSATERCLEDYLTQGNRNLKLIEKDINSNLLETKQHLKSIVEKLVFSSSRGDSDSLSAGKSDNEAPEALDNAEEKAVVNKKLSSIKAEDIYNRLDSRYILTVLVVSEDGRPSSVFPKSDKPVAQINLDSQAPYDAIARSIVDATNKQEPVCSEIFQSVDKSSMQFALVVPVGKGKGSISVVVVFQESFFKRFQKLLLLDEHSIFWVIDLAGRVVFHPVPSLVGTKLTEYPAVGEETREMIAHVAESRNGSLQMPNPFGEERSSKEMVVLFRSVSFGPNKLAYITSSPYSDVVRSVLSLSRRFLAGNLIALAFLLFMILGWSRSRTNEIRETQRKDMTRELERMVEARTVELNFVTRTIKDLIDSIPSALVVLDRNFRILLVNLSFYSILSPSVASATGRDISEVFSEEFKRRLIEIMDNKRSIIDVEMRKEIEGHGEKTLLLSVLHLLGKRDRLLLVIDDVSERRVLERQLIQAEKMAGLGTLMSGVAHEINNPLNAISGMAQIMTARSTDQETLESSKEIQRYVNRVAEIVKELSRYSRSSKVTDTVSSDINKIIDEALEMASHSRHFKDVNIEKDFAHGLPALKVNLVEIEQVFINMLTNASDALNEKSQRVKDFKPKVKISTSMHEEKFVQIVFADNGTGIPREILQSIFDPFFTTKDQGAGTGLGLSISYKIIQRYGGVILADSHQGEGTSFIIRLPLG